MSIYTLLAALVGVAAFVVYRRFASRLPADEVENIRDSLARGASLVDVRTPGEFASGHLDGAINIPLSDLSQRSRELGKPSKPVVVYCRSGARSAMAATMLTAAGFKRVHNLKVMRNWSEVSG